MKQRNKYFAYFSCNTKTLINKDHSLEVIAQDHIDAGEEITNQYMKADKPTIIRRPLLRQKWFFDCMCARCSDPTERGSHLSSLLCFASKCGGAVVPSNSLDNQSNWFCMECGAVICLEGVQTVLECAARQINTLTMETDSAVEHYERILHQLSTVLHPYNYLMINVKQKLAMLYGNIPQYSLASMTRPAKQRKIQLCQDVIDCMSQVS